ncbi:MULTISPECIES: SDR family NAD(P)-dependent oxidoreductase [Paenarthrobacter]|jgi:NAD(P)-dependent dehydrogenase (short-subunit alcohol dehydrogenase family)|uniref:SDR family NAD(P)-dependent oxidoreductase n=1 Tax=Paenarthrobacter TaxID=1742992 RepID=UPI000AEEE012|nr:glucose 1-dehydrogenase [Paenarthrobacter nitroguajacolicus]NWL33952.1 3-oxoacyl-ACP reductase [Paenarthrobacter nitroguajacolicus]
MGNFEGKTALVTGGGSGLGEAISKDLAKNGVNVVVVDVNLEAATRVAEQITADGGKAVPFQGNTAVAEDSKKAVDFAVESYGALNYAVNNAGIGGASAPVGEIDIEDWDRVIAINLSGVLYGMRYQVPAILAAGASEGAIVNMASIHGAVAAPGNAAYTAAKHGVVGMTKNAAAEYGAQGLRVNAIGPGYIDTPLLAAAPKEVVSGLEAKHPLGRLGQAEEIANVTTFLLSDKASFMTGSYVLVDGGYTAV